MSMKTYVATSKFSIAKMDQTSLEFSKGDTIDFDGTKAVHYGEEIVLPKLKVAVKAGWLADVTEETSEYQRPSANISLRGATPEQDDTVFNGVTQMSEEERVVSTVQDRVDRVEEGRGAQTQREEAPLRTKMAVVSDSNQDVKVVPSKFKTPSKARTDLSKMGEQDLRKLSSLASDPHSDVHGGVPEAVEGSREAEGIRFANEGVSDRAAGQMTQKATTAPGQPSMPVGAEAGRVVGTVRTNEERAQDRAKAARERAEAARAARVAQASPAPSEPVEVASEDDLDPSTKEGRYNVARIIHPELPEWDFSEHWTKKMTRLKDEITDEVTLRAIYASESEAIKRRMVKELGITV